MTDDKLNSESDEFQDPLENYEPPIYQDELERALCEEPVEAIQLQPFTSIAPDIPIHAALETLIGGDIACALVMDKDQRLVGIFSDRDTLDKIALEYDDVKDKPISEVMTKNPVIVRADDCSAAALGVMAAAGFRHVPVVNDDEQVVGIVSPRRAVDFLQQRFEEGDN